MAARPALPIGDDRFRKPAHNMDPGSGNGRLSLIVPDLTGEE